MKNQNKRWISVTLMTIGLIVVAWGLQEMNWKLAVVWNGWLIWFVGSKLGKDDKPVKEHIK